jgi:hypothetical protein
VPRDEDAADHPVAQCIRRHPPIAQPQHQHVALRRQHHPQHLRHLAGDVHPFLRQHVRQFRVCQRPVQPLRLAEPLRRLLRRHAHPRHLRARLLLRVHRNALAHAAGADSALHRQVCSVIHTHSSFLRKDAPDFHFVYTKKSGARCITNAAEQGTILF